MAFMLTFLFRNESESCSLVFISICTAFNKFHLSNVFQSHVSVIQTFSAGYFLEKEKALNRCILCCSLAQSALLLNPSNSLFTFTKQLENSTGTSSM